MNYLAQTTDEIEIPDSMEEIKTTLLETLGGVWKSFLEHTPYLTAGLLIIIATWILVGLVSKIISRVLDKKDSLRPSLKALALRFLSIGMWAVGLMLAAMVIFPGLTAAKALGGLGLLSVAVGFAFKDIFENFFAGILLLWKFPFEKGDHIECDGITGVVEDVQVRMTEIRKPTGEIVVVPNSVLFKNPVEVITTRPSRRVHLTVGVAYGEDVETAVEVVREAMKSCHSVDQNRPPEIYPKGFGSSSIDIDVAWWTGSKPGSVRKSKGEVITEIKKALDQNNIEIPFPYRTLTFAEPLPLAEQNKVELEPQRGS